MSKWLFKEEPEHYSFEMLQSDGYTVWDGVRNSLALKYLKSVRAGDEIIYYHTGREKAAVGLAVAEGDAYTDSEGFAVVRIKPLRKFSQTVTLSDIRRETRFRSSPLVRLPRLSVMPIDDDLWNFILGKGE